MADSALQSALAPFNSTSHSSFWIVWSLLESFGWACLIIAWVGWNLRLPRALDNMLNHGGKVSFSFYLLHAGLIHTVFKYYGLPHWSGWPALDAGLMLVLAYAATWAVATLSYHSIEEPFLHMRRQYGREPLALAPDPRRRVGDR
jgi:peptidoglycan/LPS O-acetylase OafA/YrhL